MDFSLNRGIVLILLIQYIAHYRASIVIRKHTKLSHTLPNNFPLISLHELTPITDAYQWNAHDHLE